MDIYYKMDLEAVIISSKSTLGNNGLYCHVALQYAFEIPHLIG